MIYGDATAQFNLRNLFDSATPSIKKQAQASLKVARVAVADKCPGSADGCATDSSKGHFA